MLLTLEQLEQAIPNSSGRKRSSIMTVLNEQMRLKDISTPERIAACIATFAYASNNLADIPNIVEFFERWKSNYCNSLADVGSFSAILQRMTNRGDWLASIENVEETFNIYRKCWVIFGVFNA